MSVSCGICRTMEVSPRPRRLPSTAVTVWDLKAQGIPIRSERVTGKNRYDEPVSFSRYSIVKTERED